MENLSNIPLHQRGITENIVGDDTTEDSYERMPVSSFGMNLLKQMGFDETRGIGRNPQIFKIIEPNPNYGQKGLGSAKLGSKKLKQEEEKKKEREEKIQKNVRVIITGGKYENMKGVVVDVLETKREVHVELDMNERIVKLDLDQVELEKKEIEPNRLEKAFENEEEVLSSKRDSDQSPVRHSKKKKLKWVDTHIMVKVVSKKVKDGKLYEKKVFVNEILDKYTFIALDEKKNVLDFLREKEIETVMPKVNENVKILVGEHRGKIGKLLERDKKANKVQVQMLDTLEIEQYTQDECAMFVEKF